MADSEDLCWLPAHKIAERVRSGAIRAGDVVDAVLRRCEAAEPRLHAYITIAADHARAAAAKIDALPPAKRRGALLGAPFSAKDNVLTATVRTTMASRLLESFYPANDALAVRRLRGAGALLLGKTNLPEFSMWARSGNLVAPECRNPWDLRRTCGGSSGGSGAAVAAGLAPLSIGTDDGGSIRLPAALNGVVGLMPSPGVVPLDGVVIGGAVSAAGPIARDVRDAALFLDAMAGGAAYTATLEQGVADLRLAWIGEVAATGINDPRVVGCARDAALALRQRGAVIDEPAALLIDSMGAAPASRLPDWPRYGGLRPWDLAEVRGAIADPGWESLLSPNARASGVSGAEQPPADPAADRLRRRVVEQMDDLLTRWDVVLTPTIDQIAPLVPDAWIYPYAPPEAGAREAVRQYVKYTMRANLAGCCAISIPCGFVDDMPVGLQAIGRRGAEATVLRVARAIETIMPWAHLRPLRQTDADYSARINVSSSRGVVGA